jgi:uncharacterized protein
MASRESKAAAWANARSFEAILYRRHDTPGHDACRSISSEAERRIEGTAVFTWQGKPTHLAYEVAASKDWRTRYARVRGWAGERSIDMTIERRASGDWLLDGTLAPGLSACVDVDLGFTPATNLLQIRRIGLEFGEHAEVPVAWWDLDSRELSLLEQVYERRGEQSYWYESPRFGYEALLDVAPSGFVLTYPGLWTVEAGETCG